ncbi:MAG: ATP-binding protein [Candidatus Woesearchaeota archaeon]
MISDAALLKTLKKENLWDQEQDAGIERSLYLQEIQEYLPRKEIIVLKGVRRCGKSTLMKQLMKRLIKQNVAKEQLLYINLESYELRNSHSLELFEKILEIYKQHINSNKKIYFFIDEIQVISQWERFLRTVYDRNEEIKFIVSGSNASLLSKELSTLLTGRNITLEIKPLSFEEYKYFTLKPQLEEFQLFGGFPEVVLEQSPKLKKVLLEQYFEDILVKDVIQRHNIKNGENVKNLAKYLIENSGSRFSFHSLAKALKIDKESVENYINAMKDAYLFIQVKHFSYSYKRRFDKNIQPKYYISDNGFFQIINTTKQNKGMKFENLVAIRLSQTNEEIMYWLKNTEVDFIAKDFAINVTIDTTNIKEREFQGLLDFKKKHKEFNLLLVTPEKNYDKHDSIKFVSYEELVSRN